jgi:hypothetical protein
MRRDETRKQNERSSINRRRLLTGAGFAIGAGASAVVAGAPVAACESEKPQHKGYRESEDVRTYYRLARL